MSRQLGFPVTIETKRSTSRGSHDQRADSPRLVLVLVVFALFLIIVLVLVLVILPLPKVEDVG